MFLCIAAGLTLYFTAETIVKAISWQKKFIRKTNEQQLSPPPPPSLPGYLEYMADWTQGPPSPFFSLLTHGLPVPMRYFAECTQILKIPSGQIIHICMRMVPLDRPRKGHQPQKVFDFYLRAASYKNPSFSADGLYVHKPQSFPPNQPPKMREPCILCLEDGS